MRTLKRSLLVLAGLFTPALAGAPVDAGVIPWVYDSIFGYGWGHGYGYGMPYGGYGGYGYGGYPVSYAAPVYTTNYGPGYSLADSCCCDPCSTGCSTGTVAGDCCTTAVQSAKPAAPEPTPVVSPVTPRNPPVDEFLRPTQPGTGAVGTERANPRENPGAGEEEVMPRTERQPAPRPGGGAVPPDNPNEMQEPVPDENQGLRGIKAPSDSRIAVRYVPTPTRSRIAVPSSVNRVVRIDRTTREQLVQGQSKPQLAANP